MFFFIENSLLERYKKHNILLKASKGESAQEWKPKPLKFKS